VTDALAGRAEHIGNAKLNLLAVREQMLTILAGVGAASRRFFAADSDCCCKKTPVRCVGGAISQDDRRRRYDLFGGTFLTTRYGQAVSRVR
jgi:hypothetical protein